MRQREAHREGKDERRGRANKEDDGHVEKEGGRGVEDEEGEADLLKDLVEGGRTLKEGDEAGVEDGADL